MLFLSINVIAKERTSLLLMEVHREDVIQISAPSTSSQFSSSPSFGTYPGNPFSASFSRLYPSYSYSYSYCPRRRNLKLLNKKLAPQKNQNFTQMHWWLGSGNCRRVIPGRMPLTRFWTLVLWCDEHWKWWWWRNCLIQTHIWQKYPKLKYLSWPVWRTFCQWLIVSLTFPIIYKLSSELTLKFECIDNLCSSASFRSAAIYFNFKIEF